jgi:MFS family permease
MTNQRISRKSNGHPGIFYGYFIVAAAFCSIFVLFAVYYAFGVFFKPVLEEFGWTRAMTSGAFSLSALLMGVLGIVMGGLNDRFGPRMVMILCGILIGLGYILMSQIRTIWHLYLFYGVFVGAGMSASYIPLMSTVARWFKEKRNMMSGIVAAGIGIGALIGPPAAMRLISVYNWRISYFILGVVVFVVIVVSALILKRDPGQMGMEAYGGSGGKQEDVSPDVEALTLGEAIRTLEFWMVFGIFFSIGFCVFAIFVHIAPHAIEVGISAKSAANILATIGGVSIFGKLLMGRVADKSGIRRTYLISFILMSAALFWTIPANVAWMLYFFAALFGFSYGGCAALQSPVVAELFGLRAHGLIFGVVFLGESIGGAISPILTGYLFDVMGSYRWAFILCALFSSIGIIFCAILIPKKKI